jgi:DNA repair protein RecO (recombination protein O)
MSYHIYATEGIILSSNLAGESNRFYHILTKDIGLIGVWGQGVRKLESKLRYNLDDFSYVRVHVVRGKNLWRLTDVETISTYTGVRSNIEKRLVMGRMAALVKRLLEEGADSRVYDLFVEAVSELNKERWYRKTLSAFELLFVLRLLSHLGYGMGSVPKELAETSMWDDDTLDMVTRQKTALTKIANMSLQHTHM